jgi:dTDP-4-amino-4,6-dideoxygalactose transaminase
MKNYVIPFVDLRAQYASIKGEADTAIQGVLNSCQFTLGNEVNAFEEEFAAYCNTQHGVGVNTGTSALHLALLAAGIGTGDEVITVPFTFVATVAAICYTGARPVFVDIDSRSFNMDVTALEAAITPATKVILPVHLYGQTADMAPILEMAKRRNLIVIEDAAQAHGAEYRGRRAGSLGDMGCFSFYPGKNLGAYGEGGMVVTNNADYARTIRMLRDWGAERKYEHMLKGYNFRMEGIQAAVLRVKLRHLDGWNKARRFSAARYDRLLATSSVQTPVESPFAWHVYHIYAIRTPRRHAWQQALEEQGIQTGIHYPIPVHLLPAYADLGYTAGQFPQAERAATEVLSLPMFPELTAAQCERVCDAIRRIVDVSAGHHGGDLLERISGEPRAVLSAPQTQDHTVQ